MNTIEIRMEQLQARIAELEQENATLRRSESRYRQVVENSPISMMFINTTGYITEMNAASEQLFGLAIEQLNQQGCPIFDNPQLAENGALPQMLKAFAGEASIVPCANFYDTSAIAGQKSFGKGHYAPIRDEAGAVQEIIEIAPNLSDLLEAQQAALQATQERTKLLTTIAQVANLLLKSSDYQAVLPTVVQLLGEVVESDRCGVMQDIGLHPTLGKPAIQTVAAWNKHGISPADDLTPPSDRAYLWEDVPESYSTLSAGKVLNRLICDLAEPGRSLLQAQGNTSCLFVPIIANRKLWGLFAYDNCGEPRLYSDAEVAILKIAADSLAGAIERQAKEETLRESERRYRTLFELSNEGIFRFEFVPPLPTSLSIDEQLDWFYQNCRIAEVNPTFVNQYGLDKPDDIVGKTVAHFHVDSPDNREANRAVIEQGYAIRNGETEEVVGGKHCYFLSNVVCNVREGRVVDGWGVQTDITELKQTQQALLQTEQQRVAELEDLNAQLQQSIDLIQGRDRLLEATAIAATMLLTATDLDQTVGQVLQLIGESLDTDRIAILDNFVNDTDSSVWWRVLYEWNAPAIARQSIHTTLRQGSWEGIEAWHDRLSREQSVVEQIENMPEPFRSGHLELGVKATHIVPIFVDGRYWGQIGFDDCRAVKERTPAELAVCKIAAACVGSAIQRDRTQKALLQAEQARSQELTTINAQLQQTLNRLAESERRFRELFEASNDDIHFIEFDPPIPLNLPIEEQIDRIYYDSRFTDVNPVNEQNIGLSRSEIIGRSLSVMHSPDSAGYRSLMRRLIENNWRITGAESEDVDRNGKKRYWLSNLFCSIEQDQVVRAWGVINNITPLKELQQALLRAEQARVAQFAKANLTLKKTLDVLAHEPHLDRALGHVLQVTSEQLGSTSSALWLYNPESDRFSLHLVYLNGEIIAASPETLDRLSGQWIWNGDLNRDLVLKQHIVDRAPVLYDMNSLSRGQRRVLDRLGIKAMLGIPLVLGSEIVGSFTIRFSDPRQLQPEELELTQALAHQATLATQLLKMATQAQQSAIVAERNRMARDIHDSLAQSLTGVVMQLNAATEFLTTDPQQTQACIIRAQDLAKQGLSEARRSVWLLYHNDSTASLSDALNRLIEQMTTGTSVLIDLSIEGMPYTLDAPISLNLLRIAQESLTNALRHANAQTIHLQLSYAPDQVTLQIQDDGCGFDPNIVKQGLGLLGMRDRATAIGAILQIESQSGSGTTAIVTLPFLATRLMPPSVSDRTVS